MVRHERFSESFEHLLGSIRQQAMAFRHTLRLWLYRLMGMHLIWTTQKGVDIFVEPGKKSSYDFVVRYKEPNKWLRTPKHVHLIVELYVKEAYDKKLTHQLRDHLLQVFDKVKPIQNFPPQLQVYQASHAVPFQSLDAVGEFSVEFLLVVSELIFIQEKTNYPQGSMTKKLYEAFGVQDRFSVIHMATYR